MLHTETSGGHQPGVRLKEPLHQMLAVQLTGTINCLEAARLTGLQRVTFVSSIAVYEEGPRKVAIYHEDDYLPMVTFGEIGNVKKAVEQIGLLYSKTYGISFASIRTAGSYGPACSWTPSGLMVQSAVEAKPAILPAWVGNSRTNPVYTKDTAEVTCDVQLARSIKHYYYNVSDGTNPTFREIAATVKEIIPEAKIDFESPKEEMPVPPSPKNTQTQQEDKSPQSDNPPQSIERIKEEFNFVPRTLRQGIMDFAKYLKTGEY